MPHRAFGVRGKQGLGESSKETQYLMDGRKRNVEDNLGRGSQEGRAKVSLKRRNKLFQE